MSGVTCDSKNTQVTAIDWQSKSLKGSIPLEIESLVNLQSL
jgi:hypothetical protein